MLLLTQPVRTRYPPRLLVPLLYRMSLQHQSRAFSPARMRTANLGPMRIEYTENWQIMMSKKKGNA